MPGRPVKERLLQDVGLWQTDGLITSQTCRTLRSRYEVPGLGIGTVVKYLGIVGGFLAAVGLLGVLAAVVRSEGFAAVLMTAISTGLFVAGLKLARDPLARYVHSSKVVLALGAVSLVGAVAALAGALGADERQILIATGFIALPTLGILTYRFKNIFLLIVTLLAGFHWVGSWNRMFGRSTYAVAIQDPNVMAIVALLVVGVGVLHERYLRKETSRFYLAYEAVGLVYLNLSLLIRTIHPRETVGVYIGLFTAAALAQIVAGARLKNGLLVGFGVTAMAVNIFTRYHERFWDKLDAGIFFIVGGVLLFGCSAALEFVVKRTRSRGAR